MDVLTSFAKLPITEILALAFILVVLKKGAGIDVLAYLFGSKRNEDEENGVPEDIQLARYLKAHYNDETTPLLRSIDEVGKRNQTLLEEILKYGIKCRKHDE